MTQVTDAHQWRGRTVVTPNGDKIGTLEEIYLDAHTGRPGWAGVKTGLFGMKQSFIPLADANALFGNVAVPYSREQVAEAPKVDPDGELSANEEEQLYRHYGIAGDR
jgi:sporulation protein YlmC with PRC-barrel domain